MAKVSVDVEIMKECVRHAITNNTIECKGIMLYPEVYSLFSRFSLEEVGILLKSLIEYRERGITANFDNNTAMSIMFEMMRAAADKDREAYVKKTLVNQYNASCRSRKNPETGKKEKNPEFMEWFHERHGMIRAKE